MPSFRTRAVAEIVAARRGLQRVRLDDDSHAYVLTALVGEVAVGDEVVVNTTAVDLGLGTGGWHVVHWNLSRRELDLPGAGHIMKLRYTSLQADTGAAEEQADEAGGDGVPAPAPLGGVPVLVGSLHSQVGMAAVALKSCDPTLRVVYVMTDGAALPLALSDLVADLGERGLLDATITAGHAFGGDLEAIGVPSALHLAVSRLVADVVVVAMGPGVVGTASALGTTALEVASVVDIVSALGGRPVVMARASEADARERHRGISHHTRTALALCRTACDVPLPVGSAVGALGGAIPAPHHVVPVATPDPAALLEAAGLRLTTMGRGPSDDPLFFAVTTAAAVHAAHLARRGGTVHPS
jgi:hypothetical protein